VREYLRSIDREVREGLRPIAEYVSPEKDKDEMAQRLDEGQLLITLVSLRKRYAVGIDRDLQPHRIAFGEVLNREPQVLSVGEVVSFKGSHYRNPQERRDNGQREGGIPNEAYRVEVVVT
jgi:hypothetical protein